MRWNEASRLWKKYLSNDGGYVFIDLGRMLQESKDARDNFIGDLRMAIIDAEKLASKEKEINIIQKGYFKNCVKDNLNWRYAIQHYYTFGRGISLKKGKGQKSCCYYMNFIYYLYDNYEFEPLKGLEGFAGLVSDYQMRLLNLYGYAQHFKTRGIHHIRVTWIKGYRPEKDLNAIDWINGNKNMFPQCN